VGGGGGGAYASRKGQEGKGEKSQVLLPRALNAKT
jgi:hypothetical protein